MIRDTTNSFSSELVKTLDSDLTGANRGNGEKTSVLSVSSCSIPGLCSVALLLPVLGVLAEMNQPVEYHIYAGSTHAHTVFTWSHGEQFVKNAEVKLRVVESSQFPGTNAVTKPDWEKHQGP